MNEFTKQWLTSTLATDSIRSVKSNGNNYLDVVANENRTVFVYILSSDTQVLSMGKSYKDLLVPDPVPIMDGVRKCGDLLGLLRIEV